MYETNGGFAYSQRAFNLFNYALSYEAQVNMPKKFPERQIEAYAEYDNLEEKIEDIDKRTQWGEF